MTLALFSFAAPASAQSGSIALKDSFPIGSSDGTLCQVQDRSADSKAKQDIFDRRWAVVCRDSARPVGHVYAFRTTSSDVLSFVAAQRDDAVSCTQQAAETTGSMQRMSCTLSGEQVGYSIYQERRGNTVYVGEGLAAYDSATLLALRSVMADQVIAGTIDVVSTTLDDPFAFARVQASTLKPEQALAEGYRRNLSGDFAEAAAFFETLQQRTSGMTQDDGKKINPQEYLVNRALQKSNLGEFAEADRLFEQANEMGDGTIITDRLRRNFEAMHLLNQGRNQTALDRLAMPVRANTINFSADASNLQITTPIAMRINAGARSAGLLSFNDDLKLTDAERAEIIDAQALELRGTALRLQGDSKAAESALVQAYNRAIAVRSGRVTSITRMRAQILSELAIIAEQEGEYGKAETLLRDGVDLVEIQYPETRALNASRAKLASFLLRRGKNAEARTLYQQVVENSLGKRGAVSGLENQLAPYFDLMSKDPQSAPEFFKSTQILIRPGVAETQAILSRELSGGTDESARLFRQSVDLSRDIERKRMQFSALEKAQQTGSTGALRPDLGAQIDALEKNQQVTLSRLSEFPQFRAVASSSMSLEALQTAMTVDEAYMRVAIVSGNVFLFYADKEFATSYKANIDERELERIVDDLRASVSILENGQYVTYPFEVEASRSLYKSLFGPIADRIPAKKHLIFEPDGAMLRLPVNLLIIDDSSVATYISRTEKPDGDVYDFTGVNWLGRNTDISTAVSARGFVDARSASASRAGRQYLGMGQNQPVLADTAISGVRASTQGVDESCNWSLNEWNKPISDAELVQAQSLIGQSSSEILTGRAFSDDKIISMPDLGDYRILHFATHGLVTAPRPSCPTKPALLTSFGGNTSDGLLAFDEIFDLKIDADIVILSACDTAGTASISATRAAGISSGGGTALDGLVRSFIGAGGRSILASHWPAPDDFKATERLIGGLFADGKGKSVATALRDSQTRLMDDPITSHPYYWAGFAIIGDGERPFLPAAQSAALNIDNSGTEYKR